jgi:hypothetical protein
MTIIGGMNRENRIMMCTVDCLLPINGKRESRRTFEALT